MERAVVDLIDKWYKCQTEADLTHKLCYAKLLYSILYQQSWVF